MNLISRIKNKLYYYLLKIRGASLAKGVQVYSNVEIQYPKGFSLGLNSVLYKEITIYNGTSGVFFMKDNSHVAPYGYFLIENNKIEIGNDVAIGPFCSFFCVSNSSKNDQLFRKNYSYGDIKIGNNVFIGSQCVFLPGTVINDNIVVAANSVVSGILESGYIYAGTPAKAIKKINE